MSCHWHGPCQNFHREVNIICFVRLKKKKEIKTNNLFTIALPFSHLIMFTLLYFSNWTSLQLGSSWTYFCWTFFFKSILCRHFYLFFLSLFFFSSIFCLHFSPYHSWNLFTTFLLTTGQPWWISDLCHKPSCLIHQWAMTGAWSRLGDISSGSSYVSTHHISFAYFVSIVWFSVLLFCWTYFALCYLYRNTYLLQSLAHTHKVENVTTYYNSSGENITIVVENITVENITIGDENVTCKSLIWFSPFCLIEIMKLQYGDTIT